MKREICCEQCYQKWKTIPCEYGEQLIHKRGKALRDMRCDGCNKEITKGSDCVAISVLGYGQHYYQWESEYLEYIKNEDAIDSIKILLDELSWEDRVTLFHQYCFYCGSNNSNCQCWNDE